MMIGIQGGKAVEVPLSEVVERATPTDLGPAALAWQISG
jgi:hypothetical protein